MLSHFSGWFQQDSHWGNASSPSPLNTQSMKGFLCRKSSLFPKNSGPPKMKQLLGSNAFNLAVMCNSCSWLNNHVVAAMMSGWCRYISSTIIPMFSLMVADTISHFTELFFANTDNAANKVRTNSAVRFIFPEIFRVTTKTRKYTNLYS